MISQHDTFGQEFNMLKTVAYLQIVLFVVMTFPCMAGSLSEHSIETVSISADEAFEDVQPGILHFKGNFILQSTEWKLQATQSTVWGRPDKPDKVYLEGTPAHFRIDQQVDDKQHTIEATAPVIEYLRSSNLLQLSGGAVLTLDGEMIKSSAIDFDIKTERYLAHGAGGVKIEVPPDKR